MVIIQVITLSKPTQVLKNPLLVWNEFILLSLPPITSSKTRSNADDIQTALCSDQSVPVQFLWLVLNCSYFCWRKRKENELHFQPVTQWMMVSRLCYSQKGSRDKIGERQETLTNVMPTWALSSTKKAGSFLCASLNSAVWLPCPWENKRSEDEKRSSCS